VWASLQLWKSVYIYFDHGSWVTAKSQVLPFGDTDLTLAGKLQDQCERGSETWPNERDSSADVFI